MALPCPLPFHITCFKVQMHDSLREFSCNRPEHERGSTCPGPRCKRSECRVFDTARDLCVHPAHPIEERSHNPTPDDDVVCAYDDEALGVDAEFPGHERACPASNIEVRKMALRCIRSDKRQSSPGKPRPWYPAESCNLARRQREDLFCSPVTHFDGCYRGHGFNVCDHACLLLSLSPSVRRRRNHSIVEHTFDCARSFQFTTFRSQPEPERQRTRTQATTDALHRGLRSSPTRNPPRDRRLGAPWITSVQWRWPVTRR